jgi:hypothetical protein
MIEYFAAGTNFRELILECPVDVSLNDGIKQIYIGDSLGLSSLKMKIIL